MVYRVYVEKKKGQTHEADSLLREVNEFLQIKNLESVRVLNRYDVERIDEELFRYSVNTVFSEPQVDTVSWDVPNGGVVLPWSLCPVSLTSVQTPLPSASRFCLKVSDPLCVPPRFTFWRASFLTVTLKPSATT